jgi:hypothetical protein
MKRHTKLSLTLALFSATVVLMGGCNGDEQQTEATKMDPAEHANELWTQIEDYETWKQPEDFTGWQEGNSPHGKVLKYFVNDKADANLSADGAVIVKENYSAQSEDALMSVTVMEKIKGYDPETKNWFYVKYAPDGTVMKNPAGKALAGLVGKGGDKGCIPCHASAKGDDYVFMND